MFASIKIPLTANKFCLLSPLMGGGESTKFLAIPALNNPRAGFARCKENNHV